MKAYFGIAVCLLLAVGCKKELASHQSDELNGTWELRVTDGGYSYEHKEYPANNGNTLAFSGTNQYTMKTVIDGEETTTSGTYTISEGMTCYNANLSFMKFSDSDIASIFSLSGDTLYLKTNSCVISDGVDRSYVKIK